MFNHSIVLIMSLMMAWPSWAADAPAAATAGTTSTDNTKPISFAYEFKDISGTTKSYTIKGTITVKGDKSLFKIADFGGCVGCTQIVAGNGDIAVPNDQGGQILKLYEVFNALKAANGAVAAATASTTVAAANNNDDADECELGYNKASDSAKCIRERYQKLAHGTKEDRDHAVEFMEKYEDLIKSWMTGGKSSEIRAAKEVLKLVKGKAEIIENYQGELQSLYESDKEIEKTTAKDLLADMSHGSLPVKTVADEIYAHSAAEALKASIASTNQSFSEVKAAAVTYATSKKPEDFAAANAAMREFRASTLPDLFDAQAAANYKLDRVKTDLAKQKRLNEWNSFKSTFEKADVLTLPTSYENTKFLAYNQQYIDALGGKSGAGGSQDGRTDRSDGQISTMPGLSYLRTNQAPNYTQPFQYQQAGNVMNPNYNPNMYNNYNNSTYNPNYNQNYNPSGGWAPRS